jgi:hypothetical protein
MSTEGNQEMPADQETGAITTEEMDEMYEMAAEESETAPPDWSSLTVAALKAALVERGLMTTGRKADLVARLSGASRDAGTEHTEDSTLISSDASASASATDATKESQPLESTEKLPDDVVAEHEEEGADVDEFVEWNEDVDHDGTVKVSDESGVEAIVQVVDEVKGDDRKPPETDEDGVEEGDTKTAEDVEMSVDVHRDRDLFYLTWQSKKITVPFKAEIAKDLEIYYRLKTVVAYPITTADLYVDIVRKHVELASSIHIELQDFVPEKPSKGYLKLKFGSVVDAHNAFEDLRTFKEGVTVKYFGRDDSEGHIMTALSQEESTRRGPIIYRLMYVGNLPADATEVVLREQFPEAIEVVIPCNGETAERFG